MATRAKRKRTHSDAPAKPDRIVDLLDIAPAPPPKTPAELRKRKREQKKVAEYLAREWQAGMRAWSEEFGIDRVPELPDDWHSRRSEPKSRLRPQQELCWRIFPRLFPDGRIPDDVE